MNQSLPFPDADHESSDADTPADFETALAQLEALVNRMEGGDLPLEQSLAAYQQGVALARVCQTLLDEAEERVKVLQAETLVAYQEKLTARDEDGED